MTRSKPTPLQAAAELRQLLQQLGNEDAAAPREPARG